MNRTRITPTHVTIPSLGDLVLIRAPGETLSETLAKLSRYGVSTSPTELDVHEDVRSV